MIVMCTGYWLCFLVAFAVAAAFNLPTHPNPAAGAVFYFLIGPTIVAALTAEVYVAVTKPQRETIRSAFGSGLLSRGQAFVLGVGVGSCALIVATGVWLLGTRLLPNETWAVIAVGTAVLCTLGIAPCVAAAWLHSLASRRASGNAQRSA